MLPKDPMILLSVVNTRLRDEYDSLAALCDDLGEDEDALRALLAAAGFSMMIELVQFVFGLGLCETDDVIFNTLGAAFGTLAFVIQQQMTKYRTAR